MTDFITEVKKLMDETGNAVSQLRQSTRLLNTARIMVVGITSVKMRLMCCLLPVAKV